MGVISPGKIFFRPAFTMKRQQTYLALALSIFALFITESSVSAQSAIVNVPSSGVVDTKKVYVEMDFITNYAWQRGDDRFANYLPRAVVGVGHGIEVGANVSYTSVPGGGAPMEIQPNAKWQFYQNEEKGIAASVGCIWFVPVTHRAATKTFGECYSVASKQISGKYGPRFTGGGYFFVGAGDSENTKTGAIVAYEQPLSDKLQFLLDWSSGDNRLGYVAPALNLTLPHNSSLTGGYAIANHGRGKNAFFLYYGTQF
jgi:hypothetical protein